MGNCSGLNTSIEANGFRQHITLETILISDLPTRFNLAIEQSTLNRLSLAYLAGRSVRPTDTILASISTPTGIRGTRSSSAGFIRAISPTPGYRPEILVFVATESIGRRGNDGNGIKAIVTGELFPRTMLRPNFEPDSAKRNPIAFCHRTCR